MIAKNIAKILNFHKFKLRKQVINNEEYMLPFPIYKIIHDGDIIEEKVIFTYKVNDKYEVIKLENPVYEK